MGTKSKVYTPLGGKGRDYFVRTQRLYLAEDHLLHVLNDGFSEEYKRFYFSDIQSIVISESRHRTSVTLGIAGLLVLLWVISAAVATSGEEETVGVVMGIASAVFCAVLFGINQALGRTCRCMLQTAVQKENLPSLRRERAAEKVLAVITPKITAAQGEMPAQMPELPAGNPIAVSGTVAALPARAVTESTPVRHEDGQWHLRVAVVLAIDTLVMILDLFTNHVSAGVLGVFAMFALVGCIIGALITQRGSDLGRNLQRWLWTTLGYVIVMTVLGTVQWYVAMWQNPKPFFTQWDSLKAASETPPWDSPFLLSLYVVSLVGSTTLAGVGFWLVRQHRLLSAPKRSAEELSQTVLP